MSDRGDDARLYGMSDPDDRQPPGEEGFRGEQSARCQGRTDLAHVETLPDGDRVLIEEDSGTAFAEVTGRAAGKDPSGEEQARHRRAVGCRSSEPSSRAVSDRAAPSYCAPVLRQPPRVVRMVHAVFAHGEMPGAPRHGAELVKPRGRAQGEHG